MNKPFLLEVPHCKMGSSWMLKENLVIFLMISLSMTEQEKNARIIIVKISLKNQYIRAVLHTIAQVVSAKTLYCGQVYWKKVGVVKYTGISKSDEKVLFLNIDYQSLLYTDRGRRHRSIVQSRI